MADRSKTGVEPQASPRTLVLQWGGEAPRPKPSGAGNREASGTALTKAGAASSEAGRPGFPRLKAPAVRALEEVGRRYPGGHGVASRRPERTAGRPDREK